jgi:hypothetical protein
MKIVAQVICWLCLAFLLVSLLLQIRRTPYSLGPGILIAALPFASTLAALHFNPSRAFTAIAVVANALLVIAVLLFAGEMLAVGGTSALAQAAMVAVGATPGIVNLLALFGTRAPPRGRSNSSSKATGPVGPAP